MSSKSKFRANRQKYRIVFPQGHDLHGLEIVAYGVSLGELHELQDYERQIKASGQTNSEAIEALQNIFARSLAEWNLTDENGDDVAPTRDGLNQLDPLQLLDAMTAWVTRITSVDNPLVRRSTPTVTTPTSGLAMVPMEMSVDLSS